MTVTVQWDDVAHNTLCLTYQRPWTWDEFQQAYLEVDALFKSTTDTVDLIIDIRNAGFPPPDAVPRFRRILQNQHPNRGIVAFVGVPYLVLSFVKIINRLTNGKEDVPKFQFFPSLEAARQALAFHRKTEV